MRKSGILLHISSLPSSYGIGDFGPGAFQFVDFLSSSKQQIWQILPLNPTNPMCGNSPYSSDSAFALNPVFISPEKLVEQRVLTREDIASTVNVNEHMCNFEQVYSFKQDILAKASIQINTQDQLYTQFCNTQSHWLNDYALFYVIKQLQAGKVWTNWPKALRDHTDTALQNILETHKDSIEQVKKIQYILYVQWKELKQYANDNKVHIVGDIPIYVSFDSADVWAHPEYYKLKENKRPEFIAGVPPDYFSKTGQLWGNPVYNWDTHLETGFMWWIQRLEHNFDLYDLVRIDHFRGLVAYWEIPAKEKTAIKGHWVDVPIHEFMTTIRERFSPLPFIAEDLGVITDDVKEVMNQYNLAGMKILEFAFGSDYPIHPYLPQNFVQNSVVYTGTHDNNTVRGWFVDETTPEDKQRISKYLGKPVDEYSISKDFIHYALFSVANTAIVPMQDVLCLAGNSRMNKPGVAQGNWSWRVSHCALNSEVAGYLAQLTYLSNRTVTE